MTIIVGSDIPQGQEVRWYAGGVYTTENVTVSAAQASAGYITLAGTAEYGSVLMTEAGTLTVCTEFQADGSTAATEALGTKTVKYATPTEGDVLVFYYLNIATATLTQVAACLDVKTSISADTKSAAIHGQANKLKTVGAIEQEAELERFQYSQDFLALALGSQVAGSPATGMNKFTTKITGVKKIPCLVGKRYNSGYTTVLYKWFLIGAQATGIDKEFPTEDFYKDSIKFTVDEYMEVDLVA
jgi:hypothetical protein